MQNSVFGPHIFDSVKMLDGREIVVSLLLPPPARRLDRQSVLRSSRAALTQGGEKFSEPKLLVEFEPEAQRDTNISSHASPRGDASTAGCRRGGIYILGLALGVYHGILYGLWHQRCAKINRNRKPLALPGRQQVVC